MDWNLVSDTIAHFIKVVPHAGTWIEIVIVVPSSEKTSVVPHAGTWIEIYLHRHISTPTVCRSPRGNVDWNNQYIRHSCWSLRSFPTRERGLKSAFWVMHHTSHGRSPRGNVDWNYFSFSILSHWNSRSPRGNVDWNLFKRLRSSSNGIVVPHAGTWIEIVESGTGLSKNWRRSPRGNVDWNPIDIGTTDDGDYVVPHAGTWIEIIQHPWLLPYTAVVPHAGTWIEMIHYVCAWEQVIVVPHAGTWIEIKKTGECISAMNRRSPRGNVDWNSCKDWKNAADVCRSPRGNVDWNVRYETDVLMPTLSFPTRERGLKLLSH